jgi:hypothetical protein
MAYLQFSTTPWRGAVCLLALGILTACAAVSGADQSGLSATDWVAMTDVSGRRTLEVDVGQCRDIAKSAQSRQSDSYSDPRYGAVNAMTAALDRDDMGNSARKAGDRARFELCMAGRGWQRPPR